MILRNALDSKTVGFYRICHESCIFRTCFCQLHSVRSIRHHYLLLHFHPNLDETTAYVHQRGRLLGRHPFPLPMRWIVAESWPPSIILSIVHIPPHLPERLLSIFLMLYYQIDDVFCRLDLAFPAILGVNTIVFVIDCEYVGLLFSHFFSTSSWHHSLFFCSLENAPSVVEWHWFHGWEYLNGLFFGFLVPCPTS